MNDIIKEFESKKEEISWTVYYRARNIMKIFWYDKWERFEWAILRTIKSINNEKIENENFHQVERQNTWWRPWKDFLLTKGACYFLIQNCDDRKKEVQIMSKYLKEVYQNQKIKKELIEKNQITFIFSNFKVIFSIFFIFIILFLTFYYSSSSFQRYISLKKQEISDIEYIAKLSKEMKKNEIKEEKKLQENTWSILELNKKTPEELFQESFEFYINKWWEQKYIDLWKTQNSRNDFTIYLSWENLIKSYFLLWNKAFYQDSCSLLSRKYCNSWSKDLSSFSNFWEKTTSWYEVLNVEKKQDWIYCLKINYNLKDDLNKENSITETYNYQTEKINWIEYITGRYCEKIQKNWKNRPCPYKLSNYYCD